MARSRELVVGWSMAIHCDPLWEPSNVQQEGLVMAVDDAVQPTVGRVTVGFHPDIEMFATIQREDGQAGGLAAESGWWKAFLAVVGGTTALGAEVSAGR